jgi:hypothetical protein
MQSTACACDLPVRSYALSKVIKISPLKYQLAPAEPAAAHPETRHKYQLANRHRYTYKWNSNLVLFDALIAMPSTACAYDLPVRSYAPSKVTKILPLNYKRAPAEPAAAHPETRHKYQLANRHGYTYKWNSNIALFDALIATPAAAHPETRHKYQLANRHGYTYKWNSNIALFDALIATPSTACACDLPVRSYVLSKVIKISPLNYKRAPAVVQPDPCRISIREPSQIHAHMDR